MKGLFNKVKNRLTRRRYVISTICKSESEFETAVFEANFFYLPRSWSKPALKVAHTTMDAAWDLHYALTDRLTREHPFRIFQDY